MVFTANNLDGLFTNGSQMALNYHQLQRLGLDCLDIVEEFSGFEEYQPEKDLKNTRNPIPGVPSVMAADENVYVSALSTVPSCIVLEKCALRLKIVPVAYHYYDFFGLDCSPANMNYNTILGNFNVEWEAIINLSKEDKPNVPVL